MGAQGFSSVNFGSFPGSTDTTTVITGQAGIVGGSSVECWIWPGSGTADHSIDEHWVNPPMLVAGNVVAGTGFTIYAKMADLPVAVPDRTMRPDAGSNQGDVLGRSAPMAYGSWNVAWCWN